MDAIVTARVPVEIKEQGNAILKEIGSSPTKLINAAYDYLLATHQLPSLQVAVEYLEGPQTAEPQRKKVCIVTRSMRDEVEESLEACTLPEPKGGWDQRDYREIIAEGKKADYEALG